jgi:hypothetical protein
MEQLVKLARRCAQDPAVLHDGILEMPLRRAVVKFFATNMRSAPLTAKRF